MIIFIIMIFIDLLSGRQTNRNKTIDALIIIIITIIVTLKQTAVTVNSVSSG